jgi:hypothetical protein
VQPNSERQKRLAALAETARAANAPVATPTASVAPPTAPAA